MASRRQYQVTLPGPAPWGFRLSGGKEFSLPLFIFRVTPGGRAAMANIAPGDVIVRIGHCEAENLTHIEAQKIIKTHIRQLELTLIRGHVQQTIASHPSWTFSSHNTSPASATSSVNKLYNSTPKPLGGTSSVVPTGSVNGLSSIGSGDNSAFAPVQQASASSTQAPPMHIQCPSVYKPPPVQAPSVPSPPLRVGQPFSPTRINPVQSGTSVQTGPSHLKVSPVSAPVTRISPMAPTRLSSLSATGQPPSVGAPRSPTSPWMVHSQYNTPINAMENVSETQQLLREALNRAHLEEVLHLEQLQCSLRLLRLLQYVPLSLQLHLYLLLQSPGAFKRAAEAGLGQPATPIEIEVGGRKIVHAQYDTPLPMYSTGAVQDTLEGHLAGVVDGKPEVTPPQRAPGTIDTSSVVYQMIQEESARKARMQPRVAPPPEPEPPIKPGTPGHAQSRSFRVLQMMTGEDGDQFMKLRQTKETPTVVDDVEIENHTPAQTTTTTPAAETSVEGAAEQQTTTRAGQTVRPPAHLKDYVRE
ncbi:PDLIM5 [Branchiostoma lanceolatum]|uniref:PDLIM5 protein n=1 Tax=Branchiostoma lanceolatum TaxID=7740 RepID=A0A8K0ECN9_BRALA|nr:PDLIM5 [Branchiostoma lanceolatum]